MHTDVYMHTLIYTHFFFSFKMVLPFLKFWVQQFLLLLSYFLSLKLFPCVYNVPRTFTRCARVRLATLSLETTPHSSLLPGLYSCVSILFLSTSLPLCTASSPSTWTSPFRMPSAASDIKRSSCHPSLSPLFPLLQPQDLLVKVFVLPTQCLLLHETVSCWKTGPKVIIVFVFLWF